MDIVKFLDKTWQEIPEMDNPAMIHFRNKDDVLVTKKCIMIFKGRYPLISDGGFVVAKVPERGDITKIGVFWRPEAAELFAEALLV